VNKLLKTLIVADKKFRQLGRQIFLEKIVISNCDKNVTDEFLQFFLPLPKQESPSPSLKPN
jgi:hypothetical protein